MIQKRTSQLVLFLFTRNLHIIFILVFTNVIKNSNIVVGSETKWWKVGCVYHVNG